MITRIDVGILTFDLKLASEKRLRGRFIKMTAWDDYKNRC